MLRARLFQLVHPRARHLSLTDQENAQPRYIKKYRKHEFALTLVFIAARIYDHGAGLL
jgi:hypothetical protein